MDDLTKAFEGGHELTDRVRIRLEFDKGTFIVEGSFRKDQFNELFRHPENINEPATGNFVGALMTLVLPAARVTKWEILADL